ncbi:MAG: hypothetical protein ACRBG0_03125 [Lewinella sp.]|uniref:hypothetical protein n=1 Tax=Lewinella sp. TaxID=2004506 RepID=UPI003D6A0818
MGHTETAEVSSAQGVGCSTTDGGVGQGAAVVPKVRTDGPVPYGCLLCNTHTGMAHNLLFFKNAPLH